MWPNGSYLACFVQKGKLDIAVKWINSAADPSNILTMTFTGETALKPLISSAYQAVALSKANASRVVSSAVVLTYAPDLQYGGGSCASAVLEPAQPGNLVNWESYLYSRRRSYLSKAINGNYVVALPNTKSLAFDNEKRFNYFFPDNPCLGLTMIQYKPANAGVSVDTINMQVKGHVWYDYTTSDPSRSSTAYLDQDEICQRIFTGLCLLYRPSENATHKDFTALFGKAWHWLNGGSDEAAALRKAASTVGSGVLKAIPGLLMSL